MKKFLIIKFLIIQLIIISCSQSLEKVQVFIATDDLQIGTNRFTIAVADKNGLVNKEKINLSFSGEGGYPKFNKEFKFIKFPDFYETELNNGVYTEIIEFEKKGLWKINVGDSEIEFKVNEISDSLNVGDLAPRSENLTIYEADIKNLTTGIPSINDDFYKYNILDLLDNNKQFILSLMSPAFCTDPTCGPQLETLNEVSKNNPDIQIVHVDTYTNPSEVKSDFGNRKLSPLIDEWGVDEGQWLFIISNRMIIAKFQGYASIDQISEYLN
tara:strand:- start:113 stop:922 length:810 start_codon:yes stop_codon:yes gene_type:complete